MISANLLYLLFMCTVAIRFALVFAAGSRRLKKLHAAVMIAIRMSLSDVCDVTVVQPLHNSGRLPAGPHFHCS
jgi:hypothetical protein